MTDRTATFDRPTKATLFVHLENGEKLPATPEHLAAFGLIDRQATYALAADWFRRLVDVADTDDLTLAGSMVLHTFANAITCPTVDPNPTAPTGPWAEDPDEEMEQSYRRAVFDLRQALRSDDPRWPDGYATPQGTQPVR